VKIKKNSWPPVESSSGQEYLFIEGSQDYKAIKNGFTNPNKKKENANEISEVQNIVIDYDTSIDSITMSWDPVDTAQIYEVSVNDFSATTDTNSLSIKVEDFIDKAGCSSPYDFKFKATKKVNNKKISSNETTHPISIDFSNSSYCN
jgi:hypothetical protein